jgi:DNA-binding response OmpR family regulator
VRKQILLADDSATVHQLVNLAFADEAIDVHCAPTLEKARAFLEQTTPDLILIDSVLPDGPADVLVRSLRESHETVTIPVILLTPAADLVKREEIAGLDAILSKPFESIGLLVNTVKDLLSRPRVVEMRPLVELSNQALDDGYHNDMILEIEDSVEVRSFDAVASAREMMAALSPETLDELANRIADILLLRIEAGVMKDRVGDLAKVLKTATYNSASDTSRASEDIDEAGKNPDD